MKKNSETIKEFRKAVYACVAIMLCVCIPCLAAAGTAASIFQPAQADGQNIIGGYCFSDANQDGFMGKTEKGLPDIRVTLKKINLLLMVVDEQSAITDADGYYEFSGLAWGFYLLQAEFSDGFSTTFNPALAIVGFFQHSRVVDFGLYGEADQHKDVSVSMTASPTVINKGESSLLRWTSVNADSVSIDQGIGAVALEGTLKVTPQETTLYTITATGSDNTTAQDSATVVVLPAETPPPDDTTDTVDAPSVIISADPPKVKKGEDATLYWVSTDADKATINHGIGEVPPTGSKTVNDIDLTTTYIITVAGKGGKALAGTTITVASESSGGGGGSTTTTVPPQPKVAISAMPTTINKGQSATLLWAANNASSALIEPGIGPVNAPGGTVIVSPLATTTYTITVLGPEGTASATVTVTVLDPSKNKVIVKNPNGNETWVPGTQAQVAWAAPSSINNVKLELLRGADTLTVIAAAAPNTGTYAFTLEPGMVPGSPASSSAYRIRISDAATPGTCDSSDRSFTIKPYPGIHVCENTTTWIAGSPAPISWKASPAITTVKVELVHFTGSAGTDNSTWVIAGSAPNIAAGMTVTSILEPYIGPRNRLKVSNNAAVTIGSTTYPAGAIFDLSDYDFAILGAKGIGLRDPNGGEIWHIGDTEKIAWAWTGDIPKVTISMDVYNNAGQFGHVFALNRTNTGTFEAALFGEGWLDNCTLWDTTVLKGRVRVASSDNASLGSQSAGYVEIPITRGILYAKLMAANGLPDQDRDRLPDCIEEFLGSDPLSRDSDGDGIHDFNELFGFGSFDQDAGLPDGNGDGLIAPLDPAESDDDIQSWLDADSDADGIPNYLEYYGYTYDWMSNTYSLWDGVSIDQPYFKTDPLQPSTDQDPYGDAMETSGVLMDVSVTEPGSKPMVPAYPNIVVRLEGYQINLNQDITYTEGKSLSKETNWSRETTREHSDTSESKWEHGIKVAQEIEFSPFKWGKTSFEIHTNYTWGNSSTNTTATTRSTGGSQIDQSDWEKATAVKTTEVAFIKLFLKVYNYGTTAASNIIPTLNLKIGGMNIETFRPGYTQINILEPGGTYPSQPGTYWVVDTIYSGFGDVQIALTMDQLRALECGAPVSVVMTQMDADVMLMDEQGHWQTAGKWSEYMARCAAVSSNLFFDIGDGNFIHSLVYSDDSPTSPEVTFRDALAWISGVSGNEDAVRIKYLDNAGIQQTISLEDWDFAFDYNTLLANGFIDTDNGTQPPGPNFNFFNLKLKPGSTVIGKAPRQIYDKLSPTVHYAYLDERTDLVRLCASDYNGISSVIFRDKDNNTTAMEEVISDSGIFALNINPSYISSGTEQAIVTSVNPDADQAIVPVVKVVYPVVVPVPPEIKQVFLDLDNHGLSAQVTFDSEYPLKSVTVYHNALESTGRVMTSSPYWWQDPYGWNVDLPEINAYNYDGLTVVALAEGGGYDVYVVTQDDILRSAFYGSQQILVQHQQNYDFIEGWDHCGKNGAYWQSPYIDLDSSSSFAVSQQWGSYNQWWNHAWDIAHPYDVWIRHSHAGEPEYPAGDSFLLFFKNEYSPYEGSKTFNEINRDDCLQSFSQPISSAYPVPLYTNAWVDTPAVFITRSNEGRFAKIMIDRITPNYFYDDYMRIMGAIFYHYNWQFTADLTYVTFFDDRDREIYLQGSIPEFAASFDAAQFEYATMDLDGGSNGNGTYADDVWNNGQNPPADLWLRYYTGADDPAYSDFDNRTSPGWALFSAEPFAVYTGTTAFEDMDRSFVYSQNRTETGMMLLDVQGDMSILAEPITLLVRTDNGRYAAIKITSGTTAEADGVLSSLVKFSYVTFKNPSD